MEEYSRKCQSFASGLLSREQHGADSRFTASAASSKGLWQRMAVDKLLVGHKGCVNHVQFNEAGTLLATGSDDTRLCLWDLHSSSPVVTHPTGHKANIFCVKFMPTTDSSSHPLIATCAGDAEIRLHDVANGSCSVLKLHVSRVKKLVTQPGNPNGLISCSEDGTVREVDLRDGKKADQRTLLLLARNGVKLEVNSISSPWHRPWLLAVGASDDAVRVYDRRMPASSSSSSRNLRVPGPKCIAHFSPAAAAAAPGALDNSSSNVIGSDCVTGVAFSDDGSQVLSNYLGSYIYLWSVNQRDHQVLNPRPCALQEDSVGARRKKRSREYNTAAAGVGNITTAAAAPDEQMQMEGAVTEAAAAEETDDANAAAAVGEEQDAAAAAAAGPTRRMLNVDDAVALIERGELHISRCRAGALASMVLNRSQDLYERGEVEASLRYAQAALQLRPNYGMAHYHSAICLAQQGSAAAALAEGEAALQYAWGYDLYQFVRRLRRNAAAGGDGDGEQQQQETEAAAAAAPVRPLPPALQQRLRARGILQPDPAAAAAVGEAAGDAAAAEEQPNDGDTLFAAVAAAASGGSESWSLSSSDESSGDSEDHTSSSSSSSGSSSSSSHSENSSLPSDSNVEEMEEDDSDSEGHYIMDHGELTSGSSSSSSGSSSSDDDGDDIMQLDDDESGDSWISDEDDEGVVGILGLGTQRRFYDFGGDLPQQQQQQGQGDTAAAAAPLPGHGDSERFSQFLAPLRRQLVLLQVRRQHRLQQQQQRQQQESSQQHFLQQQQQQQQGSTDQAADFQATQQQQQQQQHAGSAHSGAPGSASSSEDDQADVSDASDEQSSGLLAEDDLLSEYDPLILELGRTLAAGEFGLHSSSSNSSAAAAAAQAPLPAAAAEEEEDVRGGGDPAARIGFIDLVPSSTHTTAAAAGSSSSRQQHWSCRYRGHLSMKTVKDVAFVGPDQSLVAAGSDDGRLFVWDRCTGALVTCLRADRYVVNCVDSHPSLPIMASCGIDNTVKLWTPCLNQPRPLTDALMYCLGFNELQRAAEGSAMYTGLSDVCKSFSKQRAQQLVQQYRAEQQLAAAACMAGTWL